MGNDQLHPRREYSYRGHAGQVFPQDVGNICIEMEKNIARAATGFSPVLGGRVKHCLGGSLLAGGIQSHVGVGSICRIERSPSATGEWVEVSFHVGGSGGIR